MCAASHDNNGHSLFDFSFLFLAPFFSQGTAVTFSSINQCSIKASSIAFVHFCAVCFMDAWTHVRQVYRLSWGQGKWRWADKRHVVKAEKKRNKQTNGCVRGFESIEIEAKLKGRKHAAGAGDERPVITWQGTCDCASISDGGAPQRFQVDEQPLTADTGRPEPTGAAEYWTSFVMGKQKDALLSAKSGMKMAEA